MMSTPIAKESTTEKFFECFARTSVRTNMNWKLHIRNEIKLIQVSFLGAASRELNCGFGLSVTNES